MQNENLFKAVITNNNPFDEDIQVLFRKDNRDAIKYRVKVDGKYIFPDRPPLSKAMTALAIFHAYVRKHPDITVHDLNTVFPCSKLNSYYYKNYYRNLFYEQCKELTFDADNKTHKGKNSLAIWDFYVKPDFLMTINNGTMKAMAVRVWRKSDFEKLLSHIKNCSDFDGIVVEQIS